MSRRPPISFVYGNCVFAAGLNDCWAAFSVELSSYQWLSEDGKRARFLALLGALEASEADVQILRVARRWDVERYAQEMDGELQAEHAGGAAQARRRYVGDHLRRLGDVGRAPPR